MEPERNIEKLLRAYAKKRRADADDAFKLHPATRRMLQGEVVRRAPQPDDEPESLSLWELFRERWAVLLGFALVIFFGATLFLPALSRARMKSQHAESMSKLRQIGAAAQLAAADNSGKLPATLDALTNKLGSKQALTDDVSGQQFVYVAGGANLNGMPGTEVLAYSPAEEKDRAVLFADGSVQRVRHEEFPALTNRSQVTLALAENAPSQKPNASPAAVGVATVAPVTPPPASAEPASLANTAWPATAPSSGSISGAVATTGDFASAANSRNLSAEKLAVAENTAKFKSQLTTDNIQSGINNNSQRFRQTATAKMPPVLDSFEVQQNGDRISVVDRDGSIYNGSLQPVELAVQTDLAKLAADDKRPFFQAAKKDLSAMSNNQSQAQNYFFSVSGANRSLKQNVVFAGNLITISNSAANAAQNFGGGGGQMKSANAKVAQQPIFSNSRITGTVTIDRTNQIEINAMPVNP